MTQVERANNNTTTFYHKADPYILQKQKEMGIKKPDLSAHKKEVTKIHQEIEQAQNRMQNAREVIAQATGKKNSVLKGSRSELHARIQEIKKQQAEIKLERKPYFDEMTKLIENLKIKKNEQKEMLASSPYKNVQDLDAHVKGLETQVESGKLKVVEEKKLLQEISLLKKTRKSMGSLQKLSDSIETDKKRIEELKEKLKDTKSKELSQEFNTIQNELNDVIEVDNKEKSNLSNLFERKNAIKKELDDLYAKRKELYDNFNKANDEYNTWLKKIEEERAKQEKLQEELSEKNNFEEMIKAEIELSQIPAYKAKIDLCDTLISYLRKDILGENIDDNKKDIDTHENSTFKPNQENAPKGKLIQKDTVEDDYFTGSSVISKKKNKKKSSKEVSKSKIKIPISVAELFFDLELQPPSNKNEVEKIINDINAKKQWFKENEEQATEQKRLDAQKKIEEMKLQFSQKLSVN